MNQKNRTPKPRANRIRKLIDFIERGMNYDFCPSANQYVYWLKQPIGWVVCAIIASLLVGLTIGPQGFILMWSFLGLLALGAIWPWLSIKGINCQLSFSKSRSSEGEDTVAILEITNHWPVPIFGLMIVGDFLQDLITEDDKIAVGLQRIPGGSVSTFKWVIKPEKRGILPARQPQIANGFPFGIYHANKPIEIQGKTIIWPKRLDLKGMPEIAGTQFNISGIMSDRAGLDGDVIGVRNYRQGDSLRHIHWGKTAQRNRLIVQERQSCASRPFQIVVDLAAQVHSGIGSQNSYEWGIRIASSIAHQLHHHHAHITLICLGLPTNVEAKITNQTGLPRMMDFLAMLPSLNELSPVAPQPHLRSMILDQSQKTFLITTTASDPLPITAQQQHIVIDIQRFRPAQSTFGQNLETPHIQDVHTSSKQIQVSNPETIGSDFTYGWEQGVSSGV